MKFLYITSLIFALGLMASCKKEKTDPESTDHDHEETVTGTVTVTSPTENDTVTGAFVVKANIVATGNLHGYHLKVTKQSDDSVVFEKDADTHATSLTVNDTVKHSLTTITPLNILLESAVDHEGHTIYKNVKVIYKP